jgi:isopentenyl diphosphate isomerase/L-lactate dehydrogenase-like FMN-dependent dehydrogenase
MFELNRNRRAFLRFLAASPALPAAVQQLWAEDKDVQTALLKDPKEALNILEFEEAARRILPPAHLGYMASGVDDEVTLRANREGFKQFKLRARRLVDVSKVDLNTEALGIPLEWPLFLSPVGGQMAFHPDGELGTARAAGAKKTQMILSTQTTKPIEDIMKAAGRPIWFQLYTTSRWDVTEKLVKHAQDAGATVLAFTVDQQGGRNTETATRLRRTDTRNCSGCHEGGTPQTFRQYKPMYDGLETDKLGMVDPALTWDAVDKLKKFTKMKLVLKGIVTGDDAKLAREHGADGVIVSNHGGRAEESGRGTIECLPEVLDGAGNMPVMIDGGFRRGTDVYKALALGARAVGMGRPYIWGLSAFGQAGVERVIDMMRAELTMTMRQMGTPTMKSITKASIIRA